MTFSVSTTKIIQYAKLLVGGLMIGGLFLVMSFLYQNFYAPLTQAGAITKLKTQVVAIAVDKTALQRILAIQSSRLAPLPDTLSKIANPFKGVLGAPTPPVNRPPELR